MTEYNVVARAQPVAISIRQGAMLEEVASLRSQ